MDNLLAKIQNKKAQVGIIGMGYVGLPLAMEFGRAGLAVTGFEVDEAKAKEHLARFVTTLLEAHLIVEVADP